MSTPHASRQEQTSRRRPRAHAIGLRAGLGATVVLAALAVGGCQKTALRPDDMRSQFDRYDQARSQRAQPFLEDEFGRRTPNLTGRLLVGEE